MPSLSMKGGSSELFVVSFLPLVIDPSLSTAWLVAIFGIHFIVLHSLNSLHVIVVRVLTFCSTVPAIVAFSGL